MIAGVLIGLGTCALLAWSLRARRYRGAFQLPARRDDIFACRGDAQTFAVAVAKDGVELPSSLIRRGQTAFLRLIVQATRWGRWVDPFIEIDDGNARYRQYFERGAAGQRYLNLSPVFQPRAEHLPVRVVLRGGAIGWGGEASLILFEAPSIPADNLLVLAPHPDDAEIASYGIYASRRSWVATITAGDNGGLDLSEVVRGDQEATAWKARLRVWDSLTIPGLGGVSSERCLNLVYPDGRLRDMYADPTRVFELRCEDHLSRRALRGRNGAPGFKSGALPCTWNGLVDDLRALLEEAKPAVVVSPHPLFEVHPDHVFTTVALERALRGAKADAPLVLLYSTDVRDARLHPFGPADAVASLPPGANPDWIADSIYSHPLAPDVREGKYFAVEAEHDLRAYAAGGPATASQTWRQVRRAMSAFVAGMGLDPFSYRRRAPRPNEIYYVVGVSSLSALVERAVARDS